MIPNVTDASRESRESMLKENLRVFRTQINTYRAQHWDVSPGYPDGDTTQQPTPEAFIDQMTLSSNAEGQTAAINTPGFPYGPYFRKIPENPISGGNSMQIVNDGVNNMPPAADDSHDWIYKPQEIIIRSDTTGLDRNGELYYDY